jgi:hypothetical protein
MYVGLPKKDKTQDVVRQIVKQAKNRVASQESITKLPLSKLL